MSTLQCEKVVHGGVRPQNIVCAVDGIKVVDFDWAGVEGEVSYPWNLNQDVEWADGVVPNGLILSKHDEDMVKLLDTDPSTS